MPQIALELLRLLADGAPATLIEEQAAVLVASDPATGLVARELAMRVRTGIDVHQRREAELSALVEIARDLASLTDPGDVLDTIVRRARTLLGTDVAYLTLNDPERGDTFMRATAGSVSAQFQALRLPAGAGLGGLVAQTRRPYWTADYRGDERYQHTSEIDTAVGEEGLVAICGTPLVVDGGFVGVLFAANRGRRPFRHDEVALLGSLAALAAVSLAQSRRAAETADALAALSVAHAGIQQATAAHDRFVEVVLGGGGVDDIAAALGCLLDCWVVVLDSDDHRLASYGEAPAYDSGRDPLAGTAAVMQSAATGRLSSKGELWAVAMTAARQRLGTLVLGGLLRLDDGQGRTVERAAMVTALVRVFALRAAEADHRVRTDLLTDLLAHDGDPTAASALVERGRLLGMQLQSPHIVAVCRCGPVRPRGLLHAAARAGTSRGLAGAHRDAIVALVPGTDPAAVAATLISGLEDHAGQVTVGAAGPIVPEEGVRKAYAEAQQVATALIALGMAGQAGSASQLGFAGLVVGNTRDVDYYLDRVLGPLIAYDARRGSDLTATLDTYFTCGASPSRAAERLHVHVNTIGQRLERVSSLLGKGWQEPDQALEIQLALRLRRIREHLPNPPRKIPR